MPRPGAIAPDVAMAPESDYSALNDDIGDSAMSSDKMPTRGTMIENALKGRLLTNAASACSNDRRHPGADLMADDPRLEQAFNLIRAVIADADRRAADELVARISGARPVAHHAKSTFAPGPDKRAPRGSATVLIDRALAEAGDNGLTVLGILAKAETDFEKMVSASAVRNWLKENERKKPPRYRQVGGVWFLAGHGPTIKAVS